MQGLLARNSALQREAGELRVAVAIARANEEELARKVHACERTVESLVGRVGECWCHGGYNECIVWFACKRVVPHTRTVDACSLRVRPACTSAAGAAAGPGRAAGSRHSSTG